MGNRGAMDLVAEAKEEIENLSPSAVAAEIRRTDVLLVDLREQEEVDRQGAIPGAIHAPRGMLEFYADPSTPYHREQFDPRTRTILYCSWGGRSALACRTLKELGYRDVAHLDGGFKAWLAAGGSSDHPPSSEIRGEDVSASVAVRSPDRIEVPGAAVRRSAARMEGEATCRPGAQEPSSASCGVPAAHSPNNEREGVMKPTKASAEAARSVWSRSKERQSSGTRLLQMFLAVTVSLGLSASAGVAQAAFPGVNGKIAFSSIRDGNSEIYVVNADGSGLTNLTQHSEPDSLPAWSPDGSKIAFHRFQGVNNGEIYVMNADGSGQTNLTQHPGHDSWPAWSPDGSRIAFSSSRDGNSEIYVMNADGSGQVNLTQAPGFDASPAWSPDGSKIAFYTFRDGNREIYVMNPDGSGQTNLTQNPGSDESPAWSPDGSQIAFHSVRSQGPQIYVMNADGSGQTNLTPQSAGYNDAPDWSPDGSKIAFHREGALSVEMYVMNADGSGQTNLTPDGGDGAAPDWQPLPDEDGDGIPDDEDVEEIQEAIATLPASAFKGGDDGHRTAMHSLLNAVERAVAAGDTDRAIERLQNLRLRVDGCGLIADFDDWIVDCDAQLGIRQQVDTLISALEGAP